MGDWNLNIPFPLFYNKFFKIKVMKLPILGFNNKHSYIDFETTFGKLRFGLEELKFFVENVKTGIRTFITDANGNITASLNSETVTAATVNATDVNATTVDATNVLAVDASIDTASIEILNTDTLVVSTGTPVNAVNADEILIIAASPGEGETVTIGTTTYKFRLDALGAGVAASKVLTLNSNPLEGDTFTIGATTYKIRRDALGAGVAASAVLTNATEAAPTDGDTVTVGTRVYRFKDIPAQANDIAIGTGTVSMLRLFKAMHLTGIEGSDYFAGTAAIDIAATAIHTSAFVITITANAVGFAGNLFAKALSCAVLDWDGVGAFFTGGIDAQAANDVYVPASGTSAAIDNMIIAVTTGYSAGISGTGTVANATALATKLSTTEMTATARSVGYAGNDIVVGETFDDAASIWTGGAILLSGGIDAEAANDIFMDTNAEGAIDNLVLAILGTGVAGTNYGTGTVVHPDVIAVKKDADEMTVTAKVKGVAGNAIALAETLANAGSKWTGDAVFLSGGVDGTVGVKGAMFVDATYLYYLLAANTITGTNWRRIALGSAY